MPSSWNSCKTRGRGRVIYSFYHFCHPNGGWSVKFNDIKENTGWEATRHFCFQVLLYFIFFQYKYIYIYIYIYIYLWKKTREGENFLAKPWHDLGTSWHDFASLWYWWQGRILSIGRGSLGYPKKQIILVVVGIYLYPATPNNKYWATLNKFSCRKLA